jgi:hypothetical protein
MNDSKPSQMSLFDDEGGNDLSSDRPLPLIIASQYEFPLQHHIIDGEYFYAVQDWINGVSGTDNARQVWADMKRRYSAKKSDVAKKPTSEKPKRGRKPISENDVQRLQNELFNTVQQLPYAATDNKTYKRDYTTDKGLYLITQYMNADSGIRDKILNYLAKAGVKLDEYRLDPEKAQQEITTGRREKYLAQGKSAAWIADRELSIITRKQFTDVVQRLIGQDAPYGTLTNDVYKGVLKTDTQGLRDKLGIGAKANPRDYMHSIPLIYIRAAEEGARVALEGYADDELLPVDVVRNVVTMIAKTVGMQAEQMAGVLEIDLLTGKRLLDSGQ